ncbi:MAG: hypothetical protein ABH828_01740 [archaeon]
MINAKKRKIQALELEIQKNKEAIENLNTQNSDLSRNYETSRNKVSGLENDLKTQKSTYENQLSQQKNSHESIVNKLNTEHKTTLGKIKGIFVKQRESKYNPTDLTGVQALADGIKNTEYKAFLEGFLTVVAKYAFDHTGHNPKQVDDISYNNVTMQTKLQYSSTSDITNILIENDIKLMTEEEATKLINDHKSDLIKFTGDDTRRKSLLNIVKDSDFVMAAYRELNKDKFDVIQIPLIGVKGPKGDYFVKALKEDHKKILGAMAFGAFKKLTSENYNSYHQQAAAILKTYALDKPESIFVKEATTILNDKQVGPQLARYM